jgi:peroxiredoxin
VTSLLLQPTRKGSCMRTHDLLAILLLWSGTTLATTGQERAAEVAHTIVGTAAPQLVLTTIDGDTIDLGKLYGRKGVYLKFWATWCVPCREQMPHLEKTFQQAGDDLAVFAVDAGFIDTLADVRAFRDQYGLTMPIAIDDGRLAEALSLRVTPQHVVIGRDGRVLYVGHLVDDRLEAALAEAKHPVAAHTASRPVHDVLPAPHVGDEVISFETKTIDGTVFRSQDASATRLTAFVFLSPWCEDYLEQSRPAVSASCRDVREQVEELANENAVRWLGIASGLWATQDDLREYRDTYHVTLPLTLDESGELFRSFDVRSVPTVVITDRDGRIIRRIEGSEPRLQTVLQSLSRP